MTAEERAARFVLRGISRYHFNPDAYSSGDLEDLLALQAMLAQPRLPEEPSEEAIRAMLAGGGWTPEGGDHMRESYRALYLHLTKPKTKEVDCWLVIGWDVRSEWLKSYVCFTTIDAKSQADTLKESGCLHVSTHGPIKHTVPT